MACIFTKYVGPGFDNVDGLFFSYLILQITACIQEFILQPKLET